MWAVTCIPLRAGSPHQELSYFSRTEVPEGSIISIPLRGKDAYGLVLTCTPAASVRQTLRSSSFSLRKLADPKAKCTVSRPFLRAAFEASMTLACPPGALIAVCIPAAVLAKRNVLPEAADHEKGGDITYETLLFSHAHSERVGEYRRLARESLARGASLLILTPTVAEADSLGENLRHGIKGYVEVIHGALSPKKLTDAWKRGVDSSHPLVIVGTLLALSLPRRDITTIVLEREGSRAYSREERPYIHGAVIAEAVAKNYGARFILASTVPSVASAARRVAGEVHDIGLSASRIMGPTPEIVDLRAHKKDKGVFDPLAPLTRARVSSLLSAKKSLLILAARRGLSPLTVCDDCGSALTCERCGSTLVLHAHGGPKFLCHHCGLEESASVRCRTCGGWRLTTLGIGIDKVAESLEKHFPDTPRAQLSEVGEKVKETKIVSGWVEKGGLLIATERIIPYLPDEIDGVVVASVDSFLSIPEYSASERVFTLLAEVRSRARDAFLIQTRDPGNRVIRTITEGISGNFFRDEIADRTRYSYPPAVTLIRFTCAGKGEGLQKEVEGLHKALAHFEPLRIEGRTGKRGERRLHLLLRLPRGAWVDQRLLRFIRTLPPTIEVRVNPLSLHTD